MPLIRKGSGAPPPATDADAAAGKLRTGASDERWAAARALAGQPQALTTLADALAAEQDPRVREAIFTSLARIGSSQSAEVIVAYVRSDDASLRTGAIDALRMMPDALAAHVSILLGDPDADVRVLVCDLVRQLPGSTATGLLADLLQTESEANVCAAAIDVLAECGEPSALPALARCAERFVDVPFVVFAARIAGERMGAKALSRGV